MSDAVKAFLDKIGPRALTSEEARELQLLRVKLGLDKPGGVIENINTHDEKKS